MAKKRAARTRAGRAAGRPHLMRLMDDYLSTQLLVAEPLNEPPLLR